MKSLFAVLLIVCSVGSFFGQEPAPVVQHVTRERTFHVLHYRLAVTVDFPSKSCIGGMDVRLMPLRPVFDEVKLDAADLGIKSVTLDKKNLEYHTVDETLFVKLDRAYGLQDTLDLQVSYSAIAPKKGLYFVSPDSGYPQKEYEAWTQGEPDENHFWFPCYDFPNDKATSEMIVTVREGYTAISNGALMDVKPDAAHHLVTYHWYEGKPHSSYLISLVAGKYDEVKDFWGTVPLSYYVLPYQKADALRSFGDTPKMIEFYSNKIGYVYPWEKYAQTVVEDFIYGGEENVSATTLNDATIHDARAHLDYTSEGLVAHELAHMWWGDLLTCRDWSQSWLNEGFASFFQNQFTYFHDGHDDGAYENMESQTTSRNVDSGDKRRPTVCSRFAHPNDLFDSHIYAKGTVILNMLKDILGEELFWKSINYYAHKFAFQNVETNDFKIAIEEATGYNLGWFFDEWLYKAGYPEFEVRSDWNQSGRSLNLSVRQTQKIDSLTGVFSMPVNVEIWENDIPRTEKIWVSKAEETFSFRADQKPQLVIFDKGSRVLKRLTFLKPLDECAYQLLHADEGVDRYAAIDEMAWAADSAVVTDALRKAAVDDPFWEVRRGAVFALGDVKKTDVSELLENSYGDRDARVRAAAVTALGNYHSPQALSTLKHAFDQDSSYSVAAAALGALVKADSLHLKEYCAEALVRSSRGEIIRSTALRILSKVGDDASLNTIFANTRYGVETNIRIQCINILASKWGQRDDIFQSLLSLLHDPSFYVRRAVMGALGRLGNEKAIEPLKYSMEHEPDSRLANDARDAIDKIQKAHTDQHR
ncbi:MAG TPA: M1 family metallopeptidase [Bacteroidota bacterium]|nr:M1 family metallopeptidase [Bacteroidota bacterium]